MLNLTELNHSFPNTHNGSNGRAGGTNRKGGGPPPPPPGKGRKGSVKAFAGINGVRKAAVGGFPNMRGAAKGRKGGGLTAAKRPNIIVRAYRAVRKGLGI